MDSQSVAPGELPYCVQIATVTILGVPINLYTSGVDPDKADNIAVTVELADSDNSINFGWNNGAE